MSLTLNMVGGGGGSIKDGSAVLLVTVPTGSSVTAAKGGVTLQPTLWLSGTDASTEVALFAFSSSQFDATTPWTITATNGTDTASATVLITTNKEYDITITYNYMFVENGVLINTLQTYRSDNQITQVENNVSLTSNMTNTIGIYTSPDAIDLTPYNYLTISTSDGNFSYGRANKCPVICIGSSRPTSPDGSSAGIINITSFASIPTQLVDAGNLVWDSVTRTLDVSEYTGEYYIGITLAGTAQRSYALHITSFGLLRG